MNLPPVVPFDQTATVERLRKKNEERELRSSLIREISQELEEQKF